MAIHEPGGANLYFPYEPLFSKDEMEWSFLVFGGLKVEIWSLPGSKSGVVCLRSTQLRQGRPFFDGLPRKTLEGRMAAEQNLLREEEAAAVVGFTVQTLRKRRYLRKPPQFLKVGRNVRYRREDLRAFLEGCVVPVREA